MRTKVVVIVGVLLLVWAFNDSASLADAGTALFTAARTLMYTVERFVGGGWNA